MCCRYYLDDSTSFLAPYAKSAADSPLTEKMAAKLGRTLVVRGEVRPTDMVPAVALGRQGTEGTFPMIWGYSETGRKAPVFNARSESAGEKPMFAEGWRNRRCVIPASHFFEWGPAKTKYAIRPRGEAVTWLAGIYRLEERGGLVFPAFTILTKSAAGPMTAVHERMPVILPSGRIGEWLARDGDPDEAVRCALEDLEIAEAEAV